MNISVKIFLQKTFHKTIKGEAEVSLRHPELGDFTVKGFRLIEGEQGLFVAYPQKEYVKKGETEKRYFPTVDASKDWKRAIDEAVIQAYSVAMRDAKPMAVAAHG